MSNQQPRVLSLLSAATEIVCRLGCAHLLVGRSHGCDDPSIVTQLPIATAPKVDPNATSSELDAQVRVQSATGGAIYQINNKLVIECKPTVIITQEQCRICAVTPQDLKTSCELTSLPKLVQLVTIMPISLGDVLGDVITIAKALGVEDRGIRLVRHIQQQLCSIESVSLDILGTNSCPKVAHVEWIAPLMGSGYWIYQCVKFAGGEMVHGTEGGHSQTLEKIDLLSIADYIILAPCGFNIERTNEELNSIDLLKSEEWKNLPAVKNGNVAIADGNKYFNRSSVASIIGSTEMVAEIIFAELRGMYGHHGTRWVRLEELATFCNRLGAENARKDVTLATAVVANDDKQDGGDKPSYQTAIISDCMTVQHVSKQIAALQRGDYEEAFSMNSPANQKRLISAGKFKAIVSGWASFKLLTLSDTTCSYYEGEIKGNLTTVKVDATVAAGNDDEVISFVFDLRKSEDNKRWETDGVRIEC